MRTFVFFLVAFGGLGLLSPAANGQPPAPTVVTYDKFVEYLGLGIPEPRLLKLIADSPAVFTLGADQEAALRKAGATDTVIAAIKAKATAAPAVGDIRAFVVILDVSGSMADKDTNGVAKWGAAQKAAIDLIAAIPDGRQLSFIVYGHDAKRECQAVDVVQPLAEVTTGMKATLKGYIEKLVPAGHTPIALSLRKAGVELAKTDGLSKVLLITDGMETCHGDPNKEAAKLAEIPTFRGVDVVGLGLNAKELEAVSGIAKAGKGKFYDAQTAVALARSVAAITVAIKQPDPPKPPAAKVTGWVTPLGPNTVDKPVALPLGTAGQMVLEQNQSLFAAVTLDAGREYKVFVDMRGTRTGSVMGHAVLLDADGVEVKGLLRFGENDMQHRGVARVTVPAAGQYIVKVVNTSGAKRTLTVVVAGVPAEVPPTLTADALAKYDPRTPSLVPVPFGGDTLPRLLVPGTDATGRVDANQTAYFIAQLPAGKYRVLGELAFPSGKRGNIIGYVALLDGDGGNQKGLIGFTELNTAVRKTGDFELKEAAVVILRVKATEEQLTYTLRLRPLN